MRALILAALLLAPAAAVAAPAPDAASARAFLQSIYRFYHKGGDGAPMEPPGRWFEPVLARAIQKDMDESERTGEIGKLEADLFCDCQDFDDLSVAIGPVTLADGKAKTSVTFQNGDQVTLQYTLVWTKAGWRVFDIVSEESGSVRELYLGS